MTTFTINKMTPVKATTHRSISSVLSPKKETPEYTLELKEIVEELTDKQQELNKNLISLKDYNKTYLITGSLLLNLAQHANQIFKTADIALKNKLLRFLLYNVYLYDQKLSYMSL